MPDKTEYEKLLLACALMGGPDVARELLALVQPPMLADVRLWRAPGRPCAACWRRRPARWT